MAVQAIAGVSPTKETVVMTEYPSIAAGGIGRFLGRLYECVPVKLFGTGPSISHVFALATAPFGVLLYAGHKLFGNRYVLTNRGVQIWSSRGNRLVKSVSFGDYDHVELEQVPGQEFFKSSDIRFVAGDGSTVMRLEGVKDAGAFKSTIERTGESRKHVDASMAVIAARS